MATVYLGLGSNIEPDKNLRVALVELRERFGPLRQSPVYRSAAVGFEGPDFLNLVVELDTALEPHDIQAEIERLHELAGRERGSERNSSRSLDVDLLLYDDIVADEPALHLPRKDVLDFAFVLRPLADIAPGLEHPVTGRTIAEHWREFDDPVQRLVRTDRVF